MSKRESREIIERIVVEGDLVLLTPASLGNGDSDGLTDMSLLLDEYEERALLTGNSIAGALRNYLRERKHGFEEKETDDSIVRKLFGYHEENYAQSLLIIDDSLAYPPTDENGKIIMKDGKPITKPNTELRDGVRIEGKTRTAYVDKHGKGSKFDFELLEAGTKFRLRFELLITQDQETNKADLISAFATTLQGFEKSQNSESGEIHLGARKRRGYGECKVENWRVKTFDLTKKEGLIDWLKNGANELPKGNEQTISQAFSQALSASPIQDNREYFEMIACFALDGSMLIRSGSRLQGVGDKGQPDTVHLRSNRNGKSKAIVSGTSLAGVLRHRAVKICNTIADSKGERFVEKIFGVDMKKLEERNKTNNTKEQPFASRLEVRETVIDESKTNSLVQTRVKIDRFTGGAFEGALFDAAPVFAKSNEKAIVLSLKLRSVRLTKDETDDDKEKRTQAEIGLLLLLLKDLWTSDLPIGGESSIGRGRLKGLGAELNYKNDKNQIVKLKGNANNTAKVEIERYFEKVNGIEKEKKKEEGYNFLNSFVDALNTRTWETEANNG